MSITDRLKGLWSRGKYLVSGAALAGAFFGLPSAVNAEETPVEQETETVIEKPSDSTPKVVFRDPEKVEEEIRQIAREIYKPIKIKDFKGDAPADIKQKVKNAVQKRMGEDYRHYNIDLDEILEEEYDAAKPGLITQFLHDSSNFISEKRRHTGDVFGFTADYYRDIPSEDSYKDDLREDHDGGIYFRRIGTDRNAFFLKGEYISVENKNDSSDGHIYADGLFTILGELDKSFFRIQPTIKGGPHDYVGKTSLEIGIDLGKEVQLISCLFGGFTRLDDYYNYEGPWADSPGTYRWVEIDQRIIRAEGELALELAIGDRKDPDQNYKNHEQLITTKHRHRFIIAAYYMDQDRLYDYRKDYEGTLNQERYRYDWDFFENQFVAKFAYVFEGDHNKNWYIKISGQYSRLETEEIFDNPFVTSGPTVIRKESIVENGIGRLILQFPLIEPNLSPGTMPMLTFIFGGENHSHYGYLGLMLESKESKYAAWVVRHHEEVMRPDYYAKRNRYFRETLSGKGSHFGFHLGYRSEDKKDGDPDRLYLYGGIRGLFNFKNFVIHGNVSYYHEILTQDHPFDLHAELQIQFRTSNSNNIWGIGAELDLESEKFEEPEEREILFGAHIFWSF